MGDVRKEIVKKLTRKQVFYLCIIGIVSVTIIFIVLGLLAPEALPSFIGLL